MRRYRLASAIAAGILFLAANAAAAYATMHVHMIGGNALGLRLIEDVVPTKDEKKYFAIQLICPRVKTGRLELISANRLGSIEQYRVEYLQDKAIAIQISYRENTSSAFENVLNVELTNNEPDSSASLDLLNGRSFVSEGNRLLREICKGSETARKKYRATLNANKRILGLSSEEYPSKF